MTIRFDGRVAIVTGAGGGLGRLHALALAARGAAVVVNDLGGTLDGNGGTPTAANAVAEEIRAAGGKAIANGASVTDFAPCRRWSTAALAEWGRVDILVNNAGILRDKSFAKMELADFRLVVDVHLMGAVHCTKAVWETMRAQNYGRIVMTTSSSGPVRQLRPGQLRRRQDGARRPDADALDRRREERHPRQLPGADGGDADDREADAGGGAAPARGGRGDAGPARARRRRRADARDPVRRRRLVRARVRDADAGDPRRPRTPMRPSRSRASSTRSRIAAGETVPESGAAQGTLEIAKAMQANG